jgi:MYXO-CTERM domain-containing protein
MRKIFASGALAAVLTLGIGGPAIAQTSGSDSGQAQTTTSDDSDSGNLGLLGLLGLGGLIGLTRRDHNRDRDRSRGEYRAAVNSGAMDR